MMDTTNTTGEQVLVVDDEPTLCEIIGNVLKAEGYKPIICTHPREALVASEQESFDLAFIDIKLPEMSERVAPASPAMPA